MSQINFIRGLIDETLSVRPNLSLIEKIWILRDQIEFLQSQLVKIRGKIARKSMFWGQLMDKLKKFIVNDHFEKKSNYKDSIDWNQGWNWRKLKV